MGIVGRLTLIVTTVVAILMLLVVFIPASVWKAPTWDISSRGFDAVTMYSDGDLSSQHPGDVSVTTAQTTISSTEGSSSVIHLVTTPLSFQSAFSVRINRADAGTQPLAVGVSSPYLRNEESVVFGPEPTRQISIERMVDGQVASIRPVGTYALDELYRVHVKVDRTSRTVSMKVDSTTGSIARIGLFIANSGSEFESHVIATKTTKVTAGRSYTLSSDVLPGVSGLAGVSLDWIGANGEQISTSSQWQALPRSAAWAGQSVTARAPAGAVAVRPELATADSGSASFSDVSLTKATAPTVQLLTDGDFADGAANWRRSVGTAALDLRTYAPETVNAQVTGSTFPGLFKSLRIALSATGTAGDASAQAVLTDYQVQVPHQRWLADQVADPLLAAIVVLLGLLGLAVVVIRVRGAVKSGAFDALARRIFVVRTFALSRSNILVALAVVAYFVISIVLSHLGSLNADLVGARVWTYVAGNSGPGALYFAPNISSAEAGQWQGLPLQEAGFPYGPTMAYVFGALGLIYSTGIHQAALGSPDATSIDFLVRMANAVFGLVDFWLIALIVRRFGLTVNRSRIVAGLFLLAPALAFSNSVWGSTQSMSLAFLLAAILFMQRANTTTAWAFIFAACMTRPQNLIAAGILAVILLRVTPWRRTVRTLSTAVVLVFIALLPLALTVSPTLPVDVVVNALSLHVGDANDAWTMPVSWGAFGPWPLVATAINGVFGTGSILFPATGPLIGSLSYYHVGTLAFGLYLVVLLVIVLVRGPRIMLGGGFVLASTLGVMGLLLLETGTASYHMVLPTAMSFLLVRAVPRRTYLIAVITLSATTFLSMYGMGAYWLSSHPVWGVGVYAPGFWGSQLFSWAVTNPVVVIAASTANTAVFVLLTIEFARRAPRGPGQIGARHAGIPHHVLMPSDGTPLELPARALPPGRSADDEPAEPRYARTLVDSELVKR